MIEIRRESQRSKKTFLFLWKKQQKTNRAESKALSCAMIKKSFHFSKKDFLDLALFAFVFHFFTDDNYKRSTFTNKYFLKL